MNTIIKHLMCLLLLASCTTTEYVEKEVPIETVRTEYIQNIKYDSIYVHDSINMYSKNDTIYKEKYKIYIKTVIQKDTISKIDSIPYTITIHETKIQKVNVLKWYQKVLNTVGLISIISILMYVYFKLK